MFPVATCPELTRYQQLVAGTLAAADEETLLTHLESCDRCSQNVKSLGEPDGLVTLIRQTRASHGDAISEPVARLVEQLSKLRPGETSSSAQDETLPPRGPAPAPHVAAACTACGKAIRVKRELAGKKVRCPHCKEVVCVPDVVPGAVREEVRTTPQLDFAARAGSTVSHDRPAAEVYDFLAPAQAPDELGRLGPYRVLEVLGAGGMGVVFRAEDLQLGRQVAIKAMLPTLAASDSARQRFLREARAAAALKHDHVVTIHQVGEDRGVPFLAMEFLEGESLEDRLQREGKLPVPEVLRIGREIALGLAAAHKRSLIHRDIKPANIWLEGESEPRTGQHQVSGPDSPTPLLDVRGSDFRVKILDFGLARAAGEDHHLTREGAIIGTPAYMAPEQAQGKSLDGRCDLFSLGCVLYRLTTGAPAFRGSDMVSTLMAVATEDPPAPVSFNLELPTELSDLIMQLLTKEPAQRPKSALAVADSLLQIEKRSLSSAEMPTPASPPAGSGKKRSRIGWLVGMAGGLLAAAVAGIAILWQTAHGTVVIESDDPAIEIVFDKTGPTIKGADKEPITLRPGEHGIHIKRGTFGFETDRLEIKKGTTTTLRIKLLKDKIQVTADGRVIGVGETPRAAAVVIPPAGAQPKTTDPDRRAAEYVLSIGGGVRIRLADSQEDVPVSRLPGALFALTSVFLENNKKVTDDGLACFQGCKDVTGLYLFNVAVSDAGLAHFKDCKRLATLTLGGTKITDASLAMFKDSEDLVHLNLGGCAVNDAGLAYLKGCKNLKYLDLSNTLVTDAGMEQLHNCTNLERFSTFETLVGDRGLAQLKNCLNLKELNLQNSRATDACLVHVQHWPKLEVLNFTNLPASDTGLARLRDAKQLKTFSGTSNDLTDAALDHLSNCLDLESLYIVSNKLTDTGLAHVRNLKKLKYLLLDSPQFTDAGLEHLKDLKDLKELHLGVTKKLTNAAVQKLAKSLPECKIAWSGGTIDPNGTIDPDRRAAQYVLSIGGVVRIDDREDDIRAADWLPGGLFRLTYDSLQDNKQVTDAGLAAFNSCKNLTTLNLSRTDVGDVGLAHFKECRRLATLKLEATRVGDAGLANFKDCANLTILNLYGTRNVTDVGLANFQNCKKITELALSGSAITDAGMAHFKDCCKNLKGFALNGTKVTSQGLVHFKGCKDVTYIHASDLDDAGVACFKDCTKLTNLILGYGVSDAGLTQIKDCKELAALYVAGSNISDKTLAFLKDCKNLVSVGFSGTKVTDAGLNYLKDCRRIYDLDLRDTGIGDAALANFAAYFPNLKTVNVLRTKVTATGVKKLAAAIPKCTIEWNGIIQPK